MDEEHVIVSLDDNWIHFVVMESKILCKQEKRSN